MALRGDDLAFHFQLPAAAEQGLDQLQAEAVRAQLPAAEQVFPGLRAGIDAQQLQHHLVGLSQAHKL